MSIDAAEEIVDNLGTEAVNETAILVTKRAIPPVVKITIKQISYLLGQKGRMPMNGHLKIIDAIIAKVSALEKEWKETLRPVKDKDDDYEITYTSPIWMLI
ncbi:hypothetical protein DINM_001571 [Dirofilaria immitis]|nr:hypothetical protein [Dirofilaria immitis]